MSAFGSLNDRGSSSYSREGSARGHNLSSDEVAELNNYVRTLYSRIRRDIASDEEKAVFKSLVQEFQGDSSYINGLSSFASDVRIQNMNIDSIERWERNFGLMLSTGAIASQLLPYLNNLISGGDIVDPVEYNLGADAVPLPQDAVSYRPARPLPWSDSSASAVGSAFGSASQSAVSSGLDWNKLFSGIGDIFNGGLSGLSASLTGIGSQIASSMFNYNNQVKLIDKQNEYNTPANQMQRFADAGLNPNLVYGLGSNGNQPASGSIAPVDFDTSQRENRLAKMQIATQMAMARADIADKMASVNLKSSQADSVAEDTANMRLQNQTYMTNFINQQNLFIANYEKLIEEKREAMANADSAEARANYANDIEYLNYKIRQAERETSEAVAEFAKLRQVTGAFGDMAHIGLGANVSFGRSNVHTFK